MDPLGLGLLLLLISLVFVGIYYFLSRLAPRLRPSSPTSFVQPGATHGSESTPDAVIVVQAGGRIKEVNSKARRLFNLEEQEIPNLERLSRRIRPSADFLNLCTSEGRVTLTLEGKVVEGCSYSIPNGTIPIMLVSLRTPEINPALVSTAEGVPTQTLQTFTELSRNITASLDLDTTLRTVLEGLEKIVPADSMEITIWDAENHWLTPYHFSIKPNGERVLESSSEKFTTDSGFSGYLISQHKPLLVEDVILQKDIPIGPNRKTSPYRAYAGLPLMAEDQFIGTLEFNAVAAGAFQQSDIDLLTLLSGQAATAIHNALLYQAEKRRAAELSGLAQLSNAIGSLNDPKDIFNRLVTSISPLVEVEILGFLIYDEAHHSLEGQVPFQGIPDQFLSGDWAGWGSIPSGSKGEQILLNQDLLITSNAVEDAQWADLGLTHVAMTAGLHDSILVPLISGGRTLGFLLASNHRGEARGFAQDETHLLTIIANQTAPIIENATLIQQSRQRVQRAEALRRIASLASSAANLDEILQFSVNELAQLLRAEVGAVYLLDEQAGALRLHEKSIYGDAGSEPWNVLIPVDDPQYHFTVSGSQHALISGGLSEDQRIIPLYRPITENLHIESAIIVPLVVRDRGTGEIWLGNRAPEFFDLNDLQVVATAAGQLAGVVEQASLVTQTDESLRRRVEQLTALTRIGRELTTTLDLKYLMQVIFDEAVRTTGADCGSILLFDPQAKYEVKLSVGDNPQPELHPLEKTVVDRSTPKIVEDYEHGKHKPPHGGVLSSIIVPITYQKKVTGLIHLHSGTVSQFDNTALEIVQTLAIQAAIVHGNVVQSQEQAKRGEQISQQLDILERLMQTSQALQLEQPIEQSLGKIAAGVQEATPYQVVLISQIDPETGLLHRISNAGVPADAWEQLRSRNQPWTSVQTFLQDKFKISHSYYIPHDQKPPEPEDVHTAVVVPVRGAHAGNAWDPDDLLLIPLIASDGSALGIISVDAPRDGLQPTKATIESVEVFAAQASLAIESHRRSTQLKNQVVQLQNRAQRLQKINQSFENSLPSLLKKDMQQSVTIYNMNHQVQRIRDGLEIAEIANRQNDVHGVLVALGSELLTRMGLDIALVAEAAPGGPRLLEVLGNLPGAGSVEALFGQRNPLRQSLLDGELRLVNDLDNSADWRHTPLLNTLEGKSFLCLPVTVEKQVKAGILAIGRKPLPVFTDEDNQVFAQLANQIAISLQSLGLLNETRRRLQEVDLLLQFSLRLGSLDLTSIMRTLIDSTLIAIPNANAGMVALWDNKANCLRPQAAAGFTDIESALEITYRAGEALPGKAYAEGAVQRVEEIHFATDYTLSPENLMRYRRATGGRLPLSSMLVPIRAAESNLGLLVLDNYSTTSAFTDEDEALATSLTQQTALALENARLYEASEQRAGQLLALTNVASAITSSLSSENLVRDLLDQFMTVVPYDTATLWLRRESELSVDAARGFTDSEERLGITVAVEDSVLFNEMILTGRAIPVPDVRLDVRFPALVEPERLSWLGVPLVSKGQLIGVIALEKKEADFYTFEHIQAATTFAGQAAVALENARLYEESVRRAVEMDERSQRLALLNRLSTELSGSLDPEHILRFTAEELVQALSGSVVSAVLFDDVRRPILQAEVPQMVKELPITLPDAPIFDHLHQSLGIFATADITGEEELASLLPYLVGRGTRSLLALPLVTGNDLHGVLMLQTNTTYRFSPAEIELARTIANQSSIALQNARLFAETRRLTADLERRVEERTTELTREHRNSQTLLRIITELSASLDMVLVLKRTLLVLNEATGAELSVLLQSRAGDPQNFQRTASDSTGGSPTLVKAAMDMEKRIAEWVTHQRNTVLVEDLQNDERWLTKDKLPPVYRGMIAVPLILAEETLGALLFFNRHPGALADYHLPLVEAAARQISITINNAELFGLIRDQAERLGGMLRDQQIEASRSRAILEAVADGVLVTDANNQITLFNASAQNILNLPIDQVVGRTLDQFTGLFGRAAQMWMRTIRAWAENPAAYQAGETYSEQIDLDNNKVVAIHLAPVLYRDRFLGTVSIFRDISREVMVDRLKSEFVANVSHELRTPMTSIKGYVEILLMGAAGPLNEQQLHFLDTVKNNTQRLAVLVNDLLDISRVEAERVTLNPEEVVMSDVAADIEADIVRRSQEEDKPMTFEFNVPKDIPTVFGDVERIRQIMGNLVSNAYNYTPVNGRVQVTAQVLEKEIQVDIQDNGIGITPEEQKRVFDRFYRGENPLVLATAGTGLGLAIVKTLVEMHHGRIWFKSSGIPGEGSVFSFTLPRFDVEV